MKGGRRVLPVLLGALGLVVGGGQAAAAPTELFFSEYVEGSSNNKALEIFNGTGADVNLATEGYSVQMFFNGNPAPTLTINLTGTVGNNDVYVLAQASAVAEILAQADQTNGSGWFNGDDAVVLRRGTTIVDSIGQAGVDPGTEWGTGLTSTADNTLRRKASIQAGDPTSTDTFDPATEWDGFAQDTFAGLGGHATGGGAPVTVSCGAALTVVAGSERSQNVTATDADGRVVDIAITGITPAPAAGSISRTAFTAATAGGGTATAAVTVSDAVPTGTYAVTITASNEDAPTPQTGTCTLNVSVIGVIPIGQVQGAVSDVADGVLHRSPFAPTTGNNAGTQVVAIQGVVTQKTLARTSAGALQNGFFIQNTAVTADGDPTSSDGIFVFLGGFTTLIGGYTPTVGDEIVMTGRVSEFFNLTQLSASTRIEEIVTTTLDVNAVAPPFEASPPDSLADANRYWERREGMRGTVPTGAKVIDGRDVFPSTADGEVWLMRGDHPLNARTDPYARRSFRDPHPLDDLDPPLFDNGNGYRILLASLGIKANTGDSFRLIAPARAFDTVTNTPTGGLYFAFNKYMLQIEGQPTLVNGADPALNAPPAAPDREVEYTLADYNVENLYDFRNDPHDGCDFATDEGCRDANGTLVVRPPFDYVPASDAVYQERLTDIANQITDDLHAPDLLAVQEAEDQDICRVGGAALVCGTANDADGKPDTLQELALRIATVGGPAYDAAYDRNGADDRGIVSAFLYRTDRMQLLPVAAGTPVFGTTTGVAYRGTPVASNTDVQNPKTLNADLPSDVDLSTGVDGSNVYTRAPQVGLFRVWRDGIGTSVFTDIAAISNHFSSTPDARVGQRTEQSAYNAAIVNALDDAGIDRILSAGDFNVFPRPDDPFAPGHPLFPSDQLGPLYDDAGMTNLWDVLVDQEPQAAYSYNFVGQVQTLDHQFVSEGLLAELVQARTAHVNADFPADHPGDGARGLSDHDPMVSRWEAGPTLDQLVALVEYYGDTGEITGNNTERILLDRLANARELLEQGKLDAYASQLQAFADQARDLAPKQLTPAAAAALAEEAELLLELTT